MEQWYADYLDVLQEGSTEKQKQTFKNIVQAYTPANLARHAPQSIVSIDHLAPVLCSPAGAFSDSNV